MCIVFVHSSTSNISSHITQETQDHMDVLLIVLIMVHSVVVLLGDDHDGWSVLQNLSTPLAG